MTNNRESWLNGWHRMGNSVLLGTCVYCTCCGKYQGMTTVAFPADYEPPEKEPDWPFEEDSCPLCSVPEKELKNYLSLASVDDLANLPASKLRQSLMNALVKENKIRKGIDSETRINERGYTNFSKGIK